MGKNLLVLLVRAGFILICKHLQFPRGIFVSGNEIDLSKAINNK